MDKGASSPKDILARVERLEAIDEIRQLAAKYALSLDMRDLDARQLVRTGYPCQSRRTGRND